MRTILLLALVASAPFLVPVAQDAEPADQLWEPFEFFVGSWTGEGRGPGGVNELEREYELVLDGRYLHGRNKGTFENEVHRNWDFFSWDKIRETFVLRQFHNEGYVNRYTCTISEDEPRTYVFESEALENMQPGWGARLTLTVVDADSFRESFELRQPGNDAWMELAGGTLKRKR